MNLNFDTILRGGRVIDPAQNLDAVLDVGIAGGKIAALATGLAAGPATKTMDVKGRVVVPGLIDTHAHVFQYFTGSFGLNPEQVGVRSGVTTVVDQGGPSCITLAGFRKFIVEPSKTRVLAFLSPYLAGALEGHAYIELCAPNCCNVAHAIRAMRENPDIVRGVKALVEIGGASRWGIEVYQMCARIGRETNLPVYVHLGQLWATRDRQVMDADELVRTVVPLLKAGDVLAHPFTRHPGGFINAQGEVHPVVWEALERGVRIDVGHGNHFSFDMAKQALDAGIVPHTLGADLNGVSVRAPADDAVRKQDAGPEADPFHGVAPFCLTDAMTKMLALGIPLAEVVKMATWNPAEMVTMSDRLGSLQVGREADVTVLDMLSGRFTLQDNLGVKMVADRYLTPVFCLRGGERFEADSPYVSQPLAAAA
jgi:dihydroorotase